MGKYFPEDCGFINVFVLLLSGKGELFCEVGGYAEIGNGDVTRSLPRLACEGRMLFKPSFLERCADQGTDSTCTKFFLVSPESSDSFMPANVH